MEIFNSVVTETKIVLQQGGPVLWAMLVLSLIMYGLIVSTWIGLIRVKREVIAIDDTDVSYQNLKTVEEDIAIFALDRFAWVKRRLPMIAVLVAAISAAMITTQVGLFIAIPGAILLAVLKSQVKGIEGHLEQRVYHHRVSLRKMKGASVAI